tara:strand:- start:548 stop:1084 length:537 start_codon:yes stop_codon:yes gene_type:complete
MFNKKKLIIVILFSLFLFLVFLKGLNNPANYSPKNISIEIDSKLKGKMLFQNKEVFLVELIDENNFSLINIWASWCLPCRNEHSYLINLKKNKKINIIGINYKDKEINAKNFLEDLGNPYSKILIDPDGTKSIELGAYGVPESYLVNNKTKKIIKKYIGPIDDLKLKEIMKIVNNEKV